MTVSQTSARLSSRSVRRRIRVFAALGALVGVAACGGASGEGQEGETITLSAGTEATKGTLYYEQLAFLEKELPARTDGRIEVQLFPDEQVGDEASMLEGLRQGSLDLAVAGGANFASLAEEFQLFSVPFLFEDSEHYRAGMAPDSPLWQQLVDVVEKHDLGMQLVAPSTIGVRWIANSEGPIREANDLEELGLKMRVQSNPIETKVWSTYGAQPVNMPMPEVYSAMQQGVVNAVENSPDILENYGIHEVAPYISETNHNFYVALLLMGDHAFDKIPADLEETVDQALVDSGQHVLDLADQYQEKAVAALEENGARINSDVDTASFREPIEHMYDDVAESANATELLKTVRELNR